MSNLKLKIRTMFPALVSATSPITLVKTGLSYVFGLNISALRQSLDPFYQPVTAFIQPTSYPSSITSGHAVPFTDSDAQFGNAYSQYPLGSVSSNPLIIGKSGCTIGSSTVGQTFTIVFTSTGLVGSPITKTYTAIAGDTTTTIATALAALVNADTVLHGLGGKPIFMQQTGGAGVFNLQYDAAFAATGATPLTTATTGSTGTINLTAEQNALDFIVMQLGRNVPGRASRAGDAIYGLDFTGQDSAGTFNTHYGQMTVTVTSPTAGAARGTMIFSTSGNTGPLGRAAIGQGLFLYDANGLNGVDGGAGTVTLPSTGSFLVGGSTITSGGIYQTNIFGGALAGSQLNLQSTQSGSPSGDFVQIKSGGLVGYKYDGALTTITSPAIVLRGISGSSPVNIGLAGVISGSLVIAGSSSGATTVQPAAVASGTLTLPAATDTLVGKATTDSLTNKTLDAGTLATRLVKGVYIIAASAVRVPLTGTLTKTTLATIAVPANAMGANGIVRITAQMSYTNVAAGNWTTEIAFGGTAYISLSNGAANISGRFQTQIANRNATNSQVGTGTLQANWTGQANTVVTSAIDTTSSQNITIAGTLANVSDTVALEGYLVELIVP